MISLFKCVGVLRSSVVIQAVMFMRHPERHPELTTSSSQIKYTTYTPIESDEELSNSIAKPAPYALCPDNTLRKALDIK